MKNIQRYILSIIIILLGLSSCEDYLDHAPDFGIDEADVFNDYIATRGYLDQAFLCVYDYSRFSSQNIGLGHISKLSDEGAGNNGSLRSFNLGNWLGDDGVPEVGWGTNEVGKVKGKVIPNAFWGLRIVNRIIEKAPLMESLTEEERNGLLGQAYFFRGWFFFEIIRRVGGMPIMDHTFLPSEKQDVPRESYAACSDWIITQLDDAIDYLPHQWPGNEKGRPNKAAAYALKSMVQLYSASPLMNNPIGVIADNGYNTERCNLAAKYAMDALNYIDSEPQAQKHKMMPGGDDYKHIFYHAPNFVSDESLWYVNSTGHNRNAQSHPDIPIHFTPVGWNFRSGSWGQAITSPTQNIVDKFETSNGYPVKLVGNSWITDDPSFNTNFPYHNRDPRFRAFVVYPGESWGIQFGDSCYLATWEGGREIIKNGNNEAQNSSVVTRYVCKKYIWPTAMRVATGSAGLAGYADYQYNAIHIRTTQMYLDYAEAMNEAYGPNSDPNGYGMTAVEAINLVRARVGHVPVRSEYTSSPETFRDRIRNERAVELFFENHRWHDIRRWMIAEDIFNPPGDIYPIKGVMVTATDVTQVQTGYQGTNTPNPGNVFTYELMDIKESTRVFQKKHYWYPVGAEEANRYPNFTQNPGW